MTISSDSIPCKQVQLLFFFFFAPGDLDFSMDLPDLKVIPNPDADLILESSRAHRVQGLQKQVPCFPGLSRSDTEHMVF